MNRLTKIRNIVDILYVENRISFRSEEDKVELFELLTLSFADDLSGKPKGQDFEVNQSRHSSILCNNNSEQERR